MEVSAHLHKHADLSVPRKQQAIIKSFAKALEIIPRQLCDNAGFDATNILTQLRVEHRKGHVWAGVDFDNEGVRDNMAAFVWEPSLVKVNAVMAAVEASCLILSVDETISMSFSLALRDGPGTGTVANGPCRERTVRASASTAARLASWSGAAGTEGEGTRDAEEIDRKPMAPSCCIMGSTQRDRYHRHRTSIFIIESRKSTATMDVMRKKHCLNS